MKRAVVVAVDETEASAHTLEYFAKHYYVEGDEVHLVHCSTLPDLPVFNAMYGVSLAADTWSEVVNKANHKNDALMEKCVELLEKLGVKHIKTFLITGDAREELVKFCNDVNASCMVIGSRGLGAIKRTFLGSVSSHCVHHCKCPVLVVKPEGK
eukprot:Nk52_evm4s2010 gene=Nk52_evmTU4s2010